MAPGGRFRGLAFCGHRAVFFILYERQRPAGFHPHLWAVAQPGEWRIRAHSSVELLFSSLALVSCGEGSGLDGSFDFYLGDGWRKELFSAKEPGPGQCEFRSVSDALHFISHRGLYADRL